jgi:threonine dehydrogenase-like Zn-dependent dehydrogenase
VEVVSDGGTVVMAGAPHYVLPDAEQVFLRNLTVMGGLTPARLLLPHLLDRVLTGRLDPSPVFDLTVGLDEVPTAYQCMADRTAIKALVRI